MIYSMTGYGRTEGFSGSRQIIVELKSLNGKQFEINNRFSQLLKPYEHQIRQMLNQSLKRGSVDASIQIKQDGASKPMQVNADLAKYYFQAMKTISEELSLDWENEKKQVLPTLMTMPEIVATDSDRLNDEEWLPIRKLIEKAIHDLMKHRSDEGALIAEDILQRVRNIKSTLEDIAPFELERIPKIRERISGNLSQMLEQEKWDENRLEQELIYYIEKIDISEEKQRLAAHCDYFYELVESGTDSGIGKKLGFVLQEIGREINTLGSKANHAEIQKMVINMKDELEKAKEQVLNIL